jgi:probable F420-dependent oxidoreductase
LVISGLGAALVDVSIGLWGTPQWSNGDIPGVIESVKIAEAAGIDCFDAGDHLAFSADEIVDYPFSGGRFSSPDEPFLEPMIMLSGIATVTQRMRLATTLLLSPLRSALLLAKQAATLDVLCDGRFDLGVGVGWQKAEYDASGAVWDSRFAYLDEQIEACRALWSNSPASYHGKLIAFSDLHAKPFPRQSGGVPIWLGVKPTPRSFRRIAELGDGWLSMEPDPELLAHQVATLRAAIAAQGRDPLSVKIRARPPIIRDAGGKADLDATLALVPRFAAAGACTLQFSPFAYCANPDDFERVVKKIVAAK